MNILNSYYVSGNNYDDFIKEVSDFSENTEIKKFTNYKFKLLSFQGTEHGKYIFALIDENSINQFNNFISPLPKVILEPKDEEKVLFDEVAETSGLILLDETNSSAPMLLVGKDAIASLADRAGIAGDSIKTYSLVRNLFIAQGLFLPWERTFSDKLESTVVIRKQQLKNGSCIRKAFAFMGSKFIYSPISNLQHITDAIIKNHPMGKAECYQWSINHNLCEIHLEFPDKAEEIKQKYNLPDLIIPGIIISDSDMGKQSFQIKFAFRFENSKYPCIFDLASWKHTSKIELKEILEFIFATFSAAFEEVPEAFKEKLSVSIMPSKLKTIYKNKLKEAQFVASIGKKRTMVISEKLTNTILENPPETEYDVIKNIILLGNELDMLKYALDNFSETCGKLPFLIDKDISLKWED